MTFNQKTELSTTHNGRLPVLVGSHALRLYYVDLGREPTDYDLICTDFQFSSIVKNLLNKGLKLVRLGGNSDEPNKKVRNAFFSLPDGKTLIIDASIVPDLGAWPSDAVSFGSDTQIFYDNYVEYAKICQTELGELLVMKPDFILMMKLSHRYKKNSPHFLKTMMDIHKLRSKGVTLQNEHHLKCLLEAREALTIGKGYKLKVSKDEFFTDNVAYVYDHDSLHKAVAAPLVPAYTHYIKDGEDVMCCKEKFFNCSESIRLAGVFEEACVLALERAIIPFNTPEKKAFDIALEKVCTSITSGWFREYAWENYDRVQQIYVPGYIVKQFNLGVECGIVKPFKE